ncbi:MAG: hypothetical protein RLZZ556_451 [Actinomycetota bacterium]
MQLKLFARIEGCTYIELADLRSLIAIRAFIDRKNYNDFVPSNPDKLVELKIAGRYRMIPVWATKLDFEVRPGLKFDRRAWKYWKPSLLLLNRVAKEEKIKIKWVRVHSHFRLKGDVPHAMGWWDLEQKAMFLCHFDKETMLHEVGHALSTGYHGDPWAKQAARLYKKYLKGKEQEDAMIQLTHYLSGRRIYKSIYGEKAPKPLEIQSLWKNLKP